jgi:hypothetical protein
MLFASTVMLTTFSVVKLGHNAAKTCDHLRAVLKIATVEGMSFKN